MIKRIQNKISNKLNRYKSDNN